MACSDSVTSPWDLISASKTILYAVLNYKNTFVIANNDGMKENKTRLCIDDNSYQQLLTTINRVGDYEFLSCVRLCTYHLDLSRLQTVTNHFRVRNCDPNIPHADSASGMWPS